MNAVTPQHYAQAAYHVLTNAPVVDNDPMLHAALAYMQTQPRAAVESTLQWAQAQGANVTPAAPTAPPAPPAPPPFVQPAPAGQGFASTPTGALVVPQGEGSPMFFGNNGHSNVLSTDPNIGAPAGASMFAQPLAAPGGAPVAPPGFQALPVPASAAPSSVGLVPPDAPTIDQSNTTPEA
jgi:hypothetical protein